MSAASPLSTQLGQAAESVGLRGGQLVPLRFGSAAGELAVCMRSVGMVDREDLRVLTITAQPDAIDRLIADLVDGGLEHGEARTIAHAHWGRPDPDRVLVALPAASAPSLHQDLLRRREDEGTTVAARPLRAIGMIGPATAGLLLDLGMPYDLNGGSKPGRIVISPGPVAAWVLFDDFSALALVDPENAVELWNAIAIAGRRFGLAYIGAEAAERFETIRCQSSDRVRR